MSVAVLYCLNGVGNTAAAVVVVAVDDDVDDIMFDEEGTMLIIISDLVGGDLRRGDGSLSSTS